MAVTKPVEENKAVVRRLYAAINEREDDALLDLYASDCVMHNVPGTRGEMSGRDAMAEQLKTTREAFPDITASIEVLVAEDDLVSARLAYSATHEGEYLGVPATGREVTFGGTNVFRIEGGQVSEVWASVDTLGVLQQLGASELPPA